MIVVLISKMAEEPGNRWEFLSLKAWLSVPGLLSPLPSEGLVLLRERCEKISPLD
jgi:hypothetical protein